MARFEKRNTVVELEIGDNTWKVDMGSDEVGIAFSVAAAEIAKIQKTSGATETDAQKGMERMKKAYEKGINTILGDSKASAKIFTDDQTISYHDDVFLFIQSEFERVANEKIAKYSPARAVR